MLPDARTCYRALSARDPRFDGRFFVGVTSTGIYCRPICPARLPAVERCRFFPSAASAEHGGFRPCLRCRPERAPGRSIVDATRAVAHRAAARIAGGSLNGAGVSALAAELHVGPRQMRRAVRKVYGVSPVQLAQTHRLLLAKQLLSDTGLPIGQVALASGFSSLRRFNALFRERYRMRPSDLRGRRPTNPAPAVPGFSLRMEYRPPLNWEALLGFLEERGIPGSEVVRHGRYLRTVSIGGHSGWISVGPPADGKPALDVEVAASLVPVLMPLLARLRALFDLDAEPCAIEAHLVQDPRIAPLVRRRPGLRVPGAIDGFELAWRTVLGQQVTVRGARTLASRFVEAFSDAVAELPAGLDRFPVDAHRIVAAGTEGVAAIGLPGARAACIVALARAVTEGGLDLAQGADPAEAAAALQRLPGVGPWTAEYILLRAVRWPDAFPHGDLGLRRAMGDVPPAALLGRAERWRPWRAYAAQHLWQGRSDVPAESEPLQPRPEETA